MKLFVIALLILLSGCAGSREITNFGKTNVDEFKVLHFTDEAYEAIKDIPVIDGPTGRGYAAGVNIWSNIASFFTLNGVGRKVIVPEYFLKWTTDILVHELVHHLDDMTRDGDATFIDLDEFRIAYTEMSKQGRYAHRINWIEEHSNWLWTDLFGVGEISEHVAYSAHLLILQGGPDYMKWVFRKVFRAYEDMETPELFSECGMGHCEGGL